MGNWLKGYYCIRSSPLWGEEEESLFQQGVQLHGMYLQLAFTPHDLQSNWGSRRATVCFKSVSCFRGSMMRIAGCTPRSGGW